MKFSALFNLLLERQEVKLRTPSKSEHENLRARLCRALSKHKDLMATLDPDDPVRGLSVSADYRADAGLSEFRLAVRRGGRGGVEEKDYEVITDA